MREVDDEVVLLAVVDERPFFDFLHPVDVVIPTRDDTNHRFAGNLILVGFQGGNTQAPAGSATIAVLLYRSKIVLQTCPSGTWHNRSTFARQVA